MNKRYKLSAASMRSLAEGRGSCIASDHITVDGMPVMYMYREEPSLDHDSGWRFFSAQETQEYVDDPSHLAFYDINTIANYDPSIIPLLDSPIGTAWGKGADGEFVEEAYPDEPDD